MSFGLEVSSATAMRAISITFWIISRQPAFAPFGVGEKNPRVYLLVFTKSYDDAKQGT